MIDMKKVMEEITVGINILSNAVHKIEYSDLGMIRVHAYVDIELEDTTPFSPYGIHLIRVKDIPGKVLAQIEITVPTDIMVFCNSQYIPGYILLSEKKPEWKEIYPEKFPMSEKGIKPIPLVPTTRKR